MNKISEKKLSKLISQGSLFWNGMLFTSDEIYGKFQGYSCNTNLNLKTNRERAHIKKFVNKLHLDNLQKVLYILIEKQLENNKTTRMGIKWNTSLKKFREITWNSEKKWEKNKHIKNKLTSVVYKHIS